MIRSLKANEVLERMTYIWASTKDIQQIGCVGYNKALKIKKEIRDQMIDDGWTFPRNYVAMEYVLNYFHLEEKKLRKLSEMGGVAHAG